MFVPVFSNVAWRRAMLEHLSVPAKWKYVLDNNAEVIIRDNDTWYCTRQWVFQQICMYIDGGSLLWFSVTDMYVHTYILPKDRPFGVINLKLCIVELPPSKC